MSTPLQRGRISPLPVKTKDGSVAPPVEGIPAAELYGVAGRDRSKPRKRGDKAAARRRAKQAAKRAGMPLKAYLRSKAVK